MAKSLVLVFHKEDDGVLFEKMVIALQKRYRLVSAAELEDLLLKKRQLKNICHISFDDGYTSFYSVIFPILQKHKIPVSLFVSPQIITSKKNYWFQEIEKYDEALLKKILAERLNISCKSISRFSIMAIFKGLPANTMNDIIRQYQQQTGCGIKASENININQLKEMALSGWVTVGAHTINHPVLANENDSGCRYEIEQSIKQLESMLETPVKYFAYPNGRPGFDFGEREISYLKENNITLAFSTEPDNLSTHTNRLSIPRMGFARMGLSPSNPFIYFRLNRGKKWMNIKAIGKPSEKAIRKQIKTVLGI
jgi:peptidoglycan/xylan/chitin deacetylase (PgdA/CDA1 family)